VISGSGQVPIYVTIDALDECPNISKEIGVPPPRRKALQIVKELVELHCPNLHLCVASRPEADIQSVLEPLAYFKVSLHDQDGQKEDISEYVRSVIYSDEEQEMKRWRPEIKELAFKTLSAKADGMYEYPFIFMTFIQTVCRFRWVACQLEVLRKCLARNVERVLGELPKSLDETYMRLLEGIDEANRDDVYRLLQCLVVAIRPLTVEELAEILAIDFEDAEGIPMLNPDWRWEDQGRGLQAACSSLITIIDDSSSAITDDGSSDDGSSRPLQSRFVQFSHFSVKEFLTSPRLACSSRDTSRYHISLEPAHTVLAQACLGVLLRLDDRHVLATNFRGRTLPNPGFPLANYAARHWVTHAQFENVSSYVLNAMKYLFDPEKPHFLAWVRIADTFIDFTMNGSLLNSGSLYFEIPKFTEKWTIKWSPLYYASLCGFHDLVEHLIFKCPQHVNAISGAFYWTPLYAALAKNHIQISRLLCQHGAELDIRGSQNETALHWASLEGNRQLVQSLLSFGADPNVRDGWDRTPLHSAVNGGNADVARILLELNADANVRNCDDRAPLRDASQRDRFDMDEALPVRRIDVNARDIYGQTPLHRATSRRYRQTGRLDAARVLLEHGADTETEDNNGDTPFQIASRGSHDKFMELLIEYGAKH
jgi:ankyrin repeat protein